MTQETACMLESSLCLGGKDAPLPQVREREGAEQGDVRVRALLLCPQTPCAKA